ncbi:MAG: ATP-binding protein [Terricaulis sp.]
MQDFINHAALERAAAYALSSARSRYFLIGLMSAAILVAAGAALAAIWLGLALLVDIARNALAAQIGKLPAQHADAAGLALDITGAASLAVAPAIVWYARVDMSSALAAIMLSALVAHAAFNTQYGRRRTLAACAPFGFVALLFALNTLTVGGFAVALMAMACGGYVLIGALHQVNRIAEARRQDAEWVRQLNMGFGGAPSAAWEIDYERGRIVGGDALAALIGRPVSYRSVVDSACYAVPGDRALAHTIFTPGAGPMRQVAIEHDVLRPDGTSLRVRHQGVVRTNPDGAAARLSCVTHLSHGEATAAQSLPTQHIACALEAQAELLKTLRNEISTPLRAELVPADANASLDDMLRALASGQIATEEGVNALARVRHEAEAANLAKSQFLANMSHELRTPLNAVIGYTEILQEDAEDKGDAAALQDLNRILTAAKHLLSLINEILDLSKIEAGRMDVTSAPFGPRELLGDLIETMRPLAEQNANVITLAGEASESVATTDATKLRQCVLNLLSNACKFTHEGEIDVLFERRPHNGVAQLFISVRDTGIGMSPEHMSRLFQPFVQADPSITQRYGGTGLGLTITRRLAQLLGGEVGVQSTLGKGSVFTLNIPLDFADAASALGAAARIDALQGPEDGPLVIVIEDEADARELAARALTRAGFQVQGVGGGEAGLALVRAKTPALVLLDIFLPDRSGWRVLQSLKHDPKTQDIPVVVLSVNEDRAHALSLGAAEHIVKPAERDVLAATVMRYARQRAHKGSANPATVSPIAKQR